MPLLKFQPSYMLGSVNETHRISWRFGSPAQLLLAFFTHCTPIFRSSNC